MLSPAETKLTARARMPPYGGASCRQGKRSPANCPHFFSDIATETRLSSVSNLQYLARQTLVGQTMSTGTPNAAAAPLGGLYSSSPPRSTLVFMAACFAVVLFALVPASTRIAGLQLDGLSIGLIRALGAGLLTAPVLIIWRLRLPNNMKDAGLLLVYAFGNFAGFPVLFSLGAQRTSGAHAALIMATMPLLIGIIGIILDRRVPRRSWFLGMAIAVAGEAALVGLRSAGAAADATIVGDAVVFAGCALSAIGLVAGARLGSRMNPLGAACWAMTIAAVGLVPFAVAHALAGPYGHLDLTVMTWAAIVQITLGAAVLANISLVWALSKGGLVRIAPLQFAQPVCALFFASVLLNEQLTLSLLLVAAAIVVGIITASRGARQSSITRESVGAVIERVRSAARYLALLFLEQEKWHKPLADEREPGRPRAQPVVGRLVGQSLHVPALVEELT
jgi:drug/metabolite transporter (DMT)-like permease